MEVQSMRLCVINYDPEDCPLEQDCQYWSQVLNRCLYLEREQARKKENSKSKVSSGKLTLSA